MRRIVMLVVVALVMAAMMALMGAPAFGQPPAGVPPEPGTGKTVGAQQCAQHFPSGIALHCPAP